MMVNLSNLKQGLKQDYSDQELVNFVYSLDYLDTLTQQHLKMIKHKVKPEKMHEYVPRNAASFADFVTSAKKTRADPFSHFFMREAKKHEEANLKRKEI